MSSPCIKIFDWAWKLVWTGWSLIFDHAGVNLATIPGFPWIAAVLACFSCILSASLLKISAQGHVRSGHQVRSPDPTSKHACDCPVATVFYLLLFKELVFLFKESTWNSQDLIWVTKPTKPMSLNFDFGDQTRSMLWHHQGRKSSWTELNELNWSNWMEALGPRAPNWTERTGSRLDQAGEVNRSNSF